LISQDKLDERTLEKNRDTQMPKLSINSFPV